MKKEKLNYMSIIICTLIFIIFASHLLAHLRFTQNTKYAKEVLKIEDDIQKKLVEWSYKLYVQNEQKDKVIHDKNVVDKKNQIKAGSLDKIDNVKVYDKYNKDTNINDMDTIAFGKYFISNGNSTEPIEWVVLKRSFGKALLLSKYNIECMPYGNKKWSECDIRKWLNDSFINTAFLEDEKDKIINTNISNENCKDRIFILSEDECKKYMDSKTWSPESLSEEKAVKTLASNYIKNKANTHNIESCWTRTFQNKTNVVIQLSNGYLSNMNNNILIGIRPAIWIKYK